MGTTEEIRERIKRLIPGRPITTKEFLHFGNRAAVDQALSRLVKEGLLSRPIRGVYLRPKKNPYVGEVPAEPMAIAKAIAVNQGEIVQVHGAEAARRFGFSTQVPTKPVFLTSGPSRRFHIGKLEVAMKHISRRKLYLAGSPAGLALTALWYLGKKEVTSAKIEKIRSRLTRSEFDTLRSATAAMPGWMHRAFFEYNKSCLDD